MNTLSKNTAQNFVISYSTKSQIALIGSILGFSFIGVNLAQAASLNNSTGISNPGTTITFSEFSLTRNTALTNQYSSLGVTFTGLFYDPEKSAAPNIDPPNAGNFSPVTNPFLISFAQLQSGAAFSLISQLVSTTFEALFENTVVDSFNSETNSTDPNNFYGFTGVTFDSIRVTVGNNDSALIDNIQFNSASTSTAVPEPFTIIGTIIGGTAAIRIRKKLKVD